MNFIADLHIHSPYSRATSKASNLAGLFAWAKVKGIHLIGTGDFTHPGWFQELQEYLEPAEPGLFRLKNTRVPPALDQANPEDIDVRFVLTAEISSIYKRHDRVRKVHNILFAPDFASVKRMNQRLAAIGNIESDGRPILGLDSRDLLEIQLEEIPDGFLVPAHIWTPWFSLFGSKSGFDSIEECYGDLTPHIFALETGLSSDPDMNRLISALDSYTLISNSDCHSPSKLGREVNIFDCAFDFYSMKEALKNPQMGFSGTVEFFPEEGKYHLDGHRKCNVSLSPEETKNLNNICPVCGKPLTVGVSHRVMDLADRTVPIYPENAPTFQSLIPLQEVIGEILGRGPATKGVMAQYQKTIKKFGSEFNLYFHAPAEEIKSLSPLLAEAVSRMRNNQVIRQAGFDGQFGVIHVFEPGELDRLSGQARLFDDKKSLAKNKKKTTSRKPSATQPFTSQAEARDTGPNPEQQQAITSTHNRILVSAGPGTGKTFTLVSRIVHLVQKRKINPENIAAITFTNRAADEVQERLLNEAGEVSRKIFVGTFHRFCLSYLEKMEPGLMVVGQEERELILKKILAESSSRKTKEVSRQITEFLLNQSDEPTENIHFYLNELKQLKAIDIEAIIPFFVRQLSEDQLLLDTLSNQVRYLFVDEFQDVNSAQFQLVELLGQTAEIFAIGDPNQAIYGFRGSDLHFFLQFAASKDCQCLALTRNYRSATSIIDASTALISHNRTKNKAYLEGQTKLKGEISFFAAQGTKAEAEHVVKEIESILGGISSFSINSGRASGEQTSHSFSDIAILHRLGRQADDLAEALERRGIPFQLVGGRPFFMDRNIRGLYYWISAAAKKAGFAENLSLCWELPGIGESTLSLLEKNIAIDSKNFLKDALHITLPARAARIIKQLEEALTCFRTQCQDDLIQALSPVFKFFNIDPSCENAQRFIKLAGTFGSLEAFAIHLQENAKATIFDERAEAVSLMTLHGSKGLEFPVVFICGMDQGILPCQSPGCEEEEERRLLYVGMTRAKEKLFLSTSGAQKSSRFLEEIPATLIKTIKQEKMKRKKPSARQLKLF